jgi:intracellular multiplication protein IcmL
MAQPPKDTRPGKPGLAQGARTQRPAAPGAGPASGLRHPDEAVATVLAREAYTRERHYLLIRVILGLLAALVVMSAALLFMATRPPQNHYFATDRDGRIMPLVPIDRPISSQTDLTNWVANSVAAAYTFDFANWRNELGAAQSNFTRAGWKGFQAALKDSGLLQTVMDSKYVTTAVPKSAPVLLDSGIIEGRYAWKLQMPLLVTFQSSEKTVSQDLMVNVIVVRQPETEQPRGLGIAQLIAQ